ncbi:MAG: Ig-like domain-containing protein, partial [Elusimicrobia bacterium]|nr:Ig-like domain-containing protein [Elusimicrobiota bacterium]
MVNHFVKESWQGWLELGVMSRRYAYATRVGLGRCIGFLGVGLAVLASSLAVHAADVSVTVTVKDSAGTALNGARVAAMRFTSSGPSGTDSVTGITNPNGQVTLTLSDSKEYQIVAAATGYLPNLRDQMMGFGGESLITPSSGLTKTITLRQESGLANIDIVVQAAKGGDAKRILCDYKMESVPEPAAFGVGSVSAGSGNEQVTVTIYNLKKNTIQGSVNCFDPDLNRHAFTRLTSAQLTSLAALADGGTLTISGPLDLSVTTAFAPPPVEQEERLRVEGGISGSANLRVLLKDSDGNPLDQNAEVRVKDTLTGSFTSNNVGRRVIEVYRLSGTGLKYIDVNVFGYGGANNQSVGAVDTNWSTLTSPVQVAVTITQATGSIPFALQVNGADIFGGVSIEPDYRGRGYWSQIAGHPCATLNPGSTVNHTQTEDGRGTITRVPDGLYEVAGFSAFGGGRKSANYANNGQPGSTSDLCIAVTSGTLKVYNKAGTDLNLSRVTISLDIQSGTNGTIKGKVNFPRLVTLPSDGDGKCNCIAFPSFQTTSSSAAPQAGVVALAGTSTRSIDFTLPVKAGTSYHLDMKCSKFGAINRGSERRADLTNTTQITGVVFEMVPSGALKFVLRKPDGTSYKAQMSPEPGQDFRSFAFHSCFVNVHGPAGFGHAQCSQTTNEVTITGLPPGSYEGNIEGNGEFAYAIPPLGDLLVVEGTTTINTVTFKTGVPISPVITGTLPTPTFEPGPGSDPTEVHLIGFPHGTTFGAASLEGLVGFRRSADFLMEYRRDFGPFAGSSPIWKVKRATPGLWDFYVVVRKHFGGPGG